MRIKPSPPSYSPPMREKNISLSGRDLPRMLPVEEHGLQCRDHLGTPAGSEFDLLSRIDAPDENQVLVVFNLQVEDEGDQVRQRGRDRPVVDAERFGPPVGSERLQRGASQTPEPRHRGHPTHLLVRMVDRHAVVATPGLALHHVPDAPHHVLLERAADVLVGQHVLQAPPVAEIAGQEMRTAETRPLQPLPLLFGQDEQERQVTRTVIATHANLVVVNCRLLRFVLLPAYCRRDSSAPTYIGRRSFQKHDNGIR